MQISKEARHLIKLLRFCAQETEIESFFTQLFTDKELRELYNRLQAAEMLLEDRPYTSIVRDTGASSATVARIAKLLQVRDSGLRNVFYNMYGRDKYTKLKKEKITQYEEFSF